MIVQRWPTVARRDFAETALKQAAILHSDTGPHRITIHPDVLFSLRYIGDDHLVRELDEPRPASHAGPWPDPVTLNPDGTLANPDGATDPD